MSEYYDYSETITVQSKKDLLRLEKTTLSTIVLTKCNLEEKDFVQIGNILKKNKKLEELWMAYPLIHDSEEEQFEDLEVLKYFQDSNIKRFKLWLYDIKNIEGLKYLPPSLEQFSFDETHKNFSLSFLERFTKLKYLAITAHTKDIETISYLKTLESLFLNRITLKNLDFLSDLEDLKVLMILLGGTTNLQAISKIKNLKSLDLSWIRKLDDISLISELENLKILTLCCLSHVKTLPKFSKLKDLEYLKLEKMSQIRDLSPILNAKKLRSLSVISGNHHEVKDFEILKKPKGLKYFLGGLGSIKKNKEVNELMGLEFDYEFKEKILKNILAKECTNPNFSKTICLDYYDGPTEGLAICNNCGTSYYFKMEEWDNEQKYRLYNFYTIKEGIFEKLEELLSIYENSNYPSWVATWRFESEEIQRNMERKINNLLNKKDTSKGIILVTNDLIKGELFYRNFSSNDYEKKLASLKQELKEHNIKLLPW